VIVWRDLLSKIHGLECASGDTSGCSGDRSVCDSKAGTYLRREFSSCPIRVAMDDFSLMFVLTLENQMEMGSISGWPDEYAAWVVDLLGALKEIRNQKLANEMKRSK